MRVAYTAPPTLARMMCSDAFVRVAMGPFGSGKSSACVMEILRRASTQAPADGVRRTRWAVVRNTYRELEDTTRKTFETWIPAQLGHWREQDFAFDLAFNDVVAEVLFRALDRPEHVKKLLSLELTGAYLNELREFPKAIFDGLQGRVGRYPAVKDGGCSWRGVVADTNPWHTGHWGYKLFRAPPESFELYEQPSGLSTQAENVENLDAGYYPRLCRGKDEEWINVYVRGLCGASDKGSIYGALLDVLDKRGALAGFTCPLDGVHVAFDLGISDSTAMWPWRVGPEPARGAQRGQGVDFLGYHEATGQPLSYFFRVLDAWAQPVGSEMEVRPGKRVAGRGFCYRMFWLPHDARARTLQTGESVLDLFLAECAARRWGEAGVEIGPELSLEDGIGAGRWLLEQDTRFDASCDMPFDASGATGLGMLREYRFGWDEKNKVFSRTPLHNFASHGADAYRGAALVAKVVQGLERQTPPLPEKPAAVPLSSITMGQVMEWAKSDRERRGGGRI